MLNLDDTNSLTPMVGSAPYMSPEIKAGTKYDYKIDIWFFNLN